MIHLFRELAAAIESLQKINDPRAASSRDKLLTILENQVSAYYAAEFRKGTRQALDLPSEDDEIPF